MKQKGNTSKFNTLPERKKNIICNTSLCSNIKASLIAIPRCAPASNIKASLIAIPRCAPASNIKVSLIAIPHCAPI